MALLGLFMALFVGWNLLKSAKKDQMLANMYANLCE
jgi:hypothetical protein